MCVVHTLTSAQDLGMLVGCIPALLVAAAEVAQALAMPVPHLELQLDRTMQLGLALDLA